MVKQYKVNTLKFKNLVKMIQRKETLTIISIVVTSSVTNERLASQTHCIRMHQRNVSKMVSKEK